MCVTSAAPDPEPATINVGLGQCAGTARAGAEICTSVSSFPSFPSEIYPEMRYSDGMLVHRTEKNAVISL
jgi:hypothetical protein